MNRLVIIIIISVISVAGVSCKSKKRLAEEEAAMKKAQIEQAISKLNKLLTDNSRPLEDREKELQEIKSLKLDDSRVNALIIEVEEKLLKERQAKEQREEEERKRKEKEAENQIKKDRASKQLLEFFSKIANAATGETANLLISDALQLFEADYTPVLIVINKKGDQKDYDRPTTIRRYLELIKDQKRYVSGFENILFNNAGKITELELIK